MSRTAAASGSLPPSLFPIRRRRTPANSTVATATVSNQKAILTNQKAILANQAQIKKNQQSILANQKVIVGNQKKILKKVGK